MIQLAGPLRRAHQALPPCAPWSDMPGLERVANARVEELRRRLGRDSTTLWGPVVQLNEALRTQALEHFDEPDYPEHKRLLLARQLHRFNSLLLSYHRFLAVLEPLIERAAAKRGAPARLLELASGSGEFSMGLARLAQRKGLPLQVTGSDIQPAYVAAAQAEATRRGLPMRFEQRNAFDLGDVSPGEFDLVFIANTLHHFTPGQLAMMVAQGSRVAGTAFVGRTATEACGCWACWPPCPCSSPARWTSCTTRC